MLIIDPIKTSWDLNFLYDGIDDLKGEKDRQKVAMAVATFAQKWHSTPAAKWQEDDTIDLDLLLEAMQDYEALFALPEWSRWIGYVRLRQSLAMDDPTIKAAMNKAEEHERDLVNQLHFFELELGKIAKGEQTRILSDARFDFCKHVLERIFTEAQYHLSEKEEKVLTMMGKMARGNWIHMVDEFVSKEEMPIELDGKTEMKNLEGLLTLLRHTDPKIRKAAAEQSYALLAKHIDSGEHEFNTVLEYKKTMDQLRGYQRPDAATHLRDDVDSGLVDALTEAVTSRYDIAQRLYEVKRKILGQKKLHYYERSVPVGDVHKTVSFDQGIDYVHRAFDKLDAEFCQILKTFLEQGYIDVFPKKGKTGGAFNVGFAKNMQNFVMLNWTDTINDVTTFAHEMGHAIHSSLSSEHQNSLQYHYSLAVAEVASTFMEDFALEEVAQDLTEEDQLLLYVQKLDDMVATIFRQTAFYEFEREIHREFRSQGYLSKETIGGIYLKHLKAYMGDAIQFDEGDALTWLYIGHFRRYFYVYSYVSGLLIAKALQKKVKADPSYVQSVKYFLSAGSSTSPVDIFKYIGVDITQPSFWHDGLDEVEELLVKVEKMVG